MEKVSVGMVAQRDCLECACRSRHNAFSSLRGKSIALGISRKDESVLTPGGGLASDGCVCGDGGGGGLGHSDCCSCSCGLEGIERGLVVELPDRNGAVAQETVAFFFRSWIRSLYASFN